ncbi:adenylyl-sulfate kinase [Peribacillus simplex]|uniref:adenylyl-sulfate kinase n=1 Tax=Peribacillus simplex TaxID=1478 RepID=UPI0011A65F85|nr:adenylyl-sulfate kinase [Peribacillus simplex]
MTHHGQNNHIVWHQSTVTKRDRQSLNKHRSMMIWLTGLSGSGKSTLANLLENILYTEDVRTYLLDGDNLRHGVNRNLGFDTEDRKENIRRAAEVGKLFVDAGVVVIAAVISPFDEDRQVARSIFEDGEFVEVYVKCTLEECELRDPKGLYKKARTGEIQNFTGITQPYEEPKNPELILDTSVLSLDEASKKLLEFIRLRL